MDYCAEEDYERVACEYRELIATHLGTIRVLFLSNHWPADSVHMQTFVRAAQCLRTPRSLRYIDIVAYALRFVLLIACGRLLDAHYAPIYDIPYQYMALVLTLVPAKVVFGIALAVAGTMYYIQRTTPVLS